MTEPKEGWIRVECGHDEGDCGCTSLLRIPQGWIYCRVHRSETYAALSTVFVPGPAE